MTSRPSTTVTGPCAALMTRSGRYRCFALRSSISSAMNARGSRRGDFMPTDASSAEPRCSGYPRRPRYARMGIDFAGWKPSALPRCGGALWLRGSRLPVHDDLAGVAGPCGRKRCLELPEAEPVGDHGLDVEARAHQDRRLIPGLVHLPAVD